MKNLFALAKSSVDFLSKYQEGLTSSVSTIEDPVVEAVASIRNEAVEGFATSGIKESAEKAAESAEELEKASVGFWDRLTRAVKTGESSRPN